MGPNTDAQSTSSGLSVIINCAALVEGEYDLPLHIAGVFIVLFVSVLGGLVPFTFRRFLSSQTGILVHKCLKIFGAGIVIATATIHMIPDGAATLTSPCVGPELEAYPSFFGALILFGILTTHLVQVILSNKSSSETSTHYHHHHHHVNQSTCLFDESGTTLPDMTSHSGSNGEIDTIVVLAAQKEREPNDTLKPASLPDVSHIVTSSTNTGPKNWFAVALLEFCIAVHSIIHGLSLGTTFGNEFKPLLIAISIHQMFEGVALASILLDKPEVRDVSSSSNNRGRRLFVSVGLVLLYGLSVAVGLAIGIGIHQSFAPDAQRTLLTQGVLQSISGGILLYEGVVNIITPHFTSKAFMNAPTSSQVLHVVMLWLGCSVMAIIAIWA